VGYAGKDHTLPLLAFALQRLWRRAQLDSLRLDILASALTAPTEEIEITCCARLFASGEGGAGRLLRDLHGVGRIVAQATRDSEPCGPIGRDREYSFLMSNLWTIVAAYAVGIFSIGD
jgi:hypothetical protein